MSDADPKTPWSAGGPSSTEEERRFGQVLAEAGQIRPWPASASARIWMNVTASAARARWQIPVLLAGAAAAIIVAVLLTVPRGSRVELAGLGTLEFAPGAQYRLERTADEQRVVLERGGLRARIDHQPAGQHVAVVSPQLRVVVVGTRFRVDVGAALTTVSVEEGRVRVEKPGAGALLLGPGESATSDDPRLAEALAEARLAELAPARHGHADAVSGCAPAAPLAERRSCYQTAAAGTGLAAETALFALALLERDEARDPAAALGALDASLARFPEGVFGPEVQLARLEQLVRLHRYDDALTAARSFLQAQPEDPRAALVSLVEADLLCAQQRVDESISVYQGLVERSRRVDVQDDALFRIGLCEAQAQRTDRARADLQTYLARFPQGAHAAEANERIHR